MLFSSSQEFAACVGQKRPPLIIIRGQDDFGIDEALERIWPLFSGYVVKKLVEPSELAAHVGSFSLFSEKRLLFLELEEALPEKEEALLCSYLKRPDPDMIILIKGSYTG